MVKHIAGLQQLADLGTKAFDGPRLLELLGLWRIGRWSLMEEAEAEAQAIGKATAWKPQATSSTSTTARSTSTTSSQSTAAATNNTTTAAAAAEPRGIWIGALLKVFIVLSCLVQPSAAARSSTEGLQVDFSWELYCVVVLMIVGAIALWEGVKWLLEWWWLPNTKTVAEVRRGRKLTFRAWGRWTSALRSGSCEFKGWIDGAGAG